MTTTFHNQDLADRMAAYGAHTDGTVVDQSYHREVDYTDILPLSEVQARGGRITRVRLLSEFIPGRGRVVDVSYIHATLKDGTMVPVRIDFDGFLIPMNQVKGRFIEWAKEQGVFAKGLGLLDEGNWSVLR